MRVLFVYKYLTLGGVEAVLRTRLEGLERCGIEAHAWFFHDYGGRGMFRAVADRVHVGEVPACIDFLSAGGFDLVSSIDTEEIFPFFTAARGLPMLVLEAHSAYRPNLSYLDSLAEVELAAVLVPSAHHAAFIRQRVGGVPVHVVPNPVGQMFAEEPTPVVPRPLRPAVVWVGRLDEHKGWDAFLAVATGLAARRPEVEAWIVGAPVGISAADLRRAASDCGLLPRLRWFRSLPHAAMPALFDLVRDSDGAAVVTSRGESFGMTVVEAMARGCPVVVPDQGPFGEFVVHGENGVCYPAGDTNAAAAALQALLDDPASRREIGCRARSTILERFAPDAALPLLAERLHELAKLPARATGH